MCLHSFLQGDYPHWNDSAIAAAQQRARMWIYSGPIVLFTATLLALTFNIYMHGLKIRWRRYTVVIALIISIQTIMEILVHWGVSIGRWEIIPRILPNHCKVSWLVEGGLSEGTWACTRERLVKAWWKGDLWGIFGPDCARFSIPAFIVPVGMWYWGNWEVWKWWTGRSGEKERERERRRVAKKGEVLNDDGR